MNLNIVDDLRKKKSGCASPSPAAAPVAWVAMASGTGAGGCNSQGQHDPDPRGFTMLSHFRLFPVYHPFISVYPGRPFIPFIPATWPVNAVFRSPGSGL